MKRLFFGVCYFFFAVCAYSENISGTWYRNLDNAEGVLTIKNNMEFSIEVQAFAHSGGTEGVIKKIRNGHYIAEITGEPGVYDEKMIMTFRYHTNYIDVSVKGAEIGLGARAFYDGKYDRRKRSQKEILDAGLNNIFEGRFDLSIIRQLLAAGDDSEYFLQCFASTEVYEGENTVIISGCLPGVAPWQNGVILIRGDIVHIMMTDCRKKDTIALRHLTNDTSAVELPAGYEDWHYFSKIKRIVHVGLDGKETERYIFAANSSKTESKTTDSTAFDNQIDTTNMNIKNSEKTHGHKNSGSIVIIVIGLIIISITMYFIIHNDRCYRVSNGFNSEQKKR